jgi:hypothetical protein
MFVESATSSVGAQLGLTPTEPVVVAFGFYKHMAPSGAERNKKSDGFNETPSLFIFQRRVRLRSSGLRSALRTELRTRR